MALELCTLQGPLVPRSLQIYLRSMIHIMVVVASQQCFTISCQAGAVQGACV
jgi:hypothetical protein